MELGYKDANTVEIQRVHRLGKKRDDEKPRSIIARFLRYKDWEEILDMGSRLRGSTFIRKPRRDFRLRTSDFGLPTSDFRLPTSDFRLPTSDFRLPTSDFRLPTSDFPTSRPPTSAFGLHTSDFPVRPRI